MSGGRKKRLDVNRNEDRMARVLDQVSDFEEFKNEILPKLRKMLKEGKRSPEIREFVQALLTARQATIALDPSVDPSVALRAIDSITHQNEGKPTERIKHTHQLENLTDQELDSVLASKLASAAQRNKTAIQ